MYMCRCHAYILVNESHNNAVITNFFFLLVYVIILFVLYILHVYYYGILGGGGGGGGRSQCAPPPLCMQPWFTFRKYFKGENFHEFHDFTATHESFLLEILGLPHPVCDQFTFRESVLSEMLPSYQSTKVFSLESFPPYGT